MDAHEPVRLHTSSGTTGKPKAVFFSRADINNSAELMARSLVMAGVTSRDVFQNMMSYGLFTGGLVMHYGAERVGCLVIPAGPGTSERQLMLMQDFHTTAVHILPSYALYFAGFPGAPGHGPAPGPDAAEGVCRRGTAHRGNPGAESSRPWGWRCIIRTA